MSIEVGDAPMEYKKIKSRDTVCAKCGAPMIIKLPAPKGKQLAAEVKKGVLHRSSMSCQRCGCTSGRDR